MKKSFIYIAALALIASCNKPESPVPSQESNIITAQIEQEPATKTYMDAHNNIRWSEGDQIVGFMKSSLGLKYQILPSSVGKTSASFENVSGSNGNINAGTEWDHNIVYYPYSTSIEAAKSGSNYTLDVTLPSEQTYAAESFGNGSMAMVAVSEDNNIVFKNVLGGMKLQLRGTQKVKSIKLQGKNNEKLSGAATVTAYTDETKPAITMSSSASTSVTLNCGSGVQLSESTATEFIIALPPVLFGSGFTITVTDSENQNYTVETDNSNEVKRSSLLVMPAITLVTSEGEDPEIAAGDYVDEYGKNRGPGVKIGETVWAPVNCGYHETDFKYGKLYQWGRKYGQGYEGDICDMNGSSGGTYSDATVPTIEDGGISVETGQNESNSNVFFTSRSAYNYNWLDPQDDKLWNSGTEENPVKTEYDPCPDGWRVPTCAELYQLNNYYSSWTSDGNGHSGRWFSGPKSYSSEVPQVFLPAAGDRYYGGGTSARGLYGYYWSSTPYYDRYAGRLAYYLYFSSGSVNASYRSYRANGYSVRCVQATDEVAEL